MKKIGVALLASALVAGCASSISRQVGKDYYAVGDASNLRAYVYGEHTVVEFQDTPSFLWVAPPIISFQDDNGVNIGYEREGRFYRLDRRVGTFTMRLNGRTTEFRTSVEPGKNKSYSVAPVPAVRDANAPASNADISVIVPEIDVLANLRTVMEDQVEDIKRAVDAHQNRTGLTETDIPA